ncbi:hypothetical protein Fmac_019991 [Flemingia macrophylla]|uniref:Katanin p60 ATPase-containing subunit A1 MIT domain-containing protein n=1 Tax=Flemingia macrophylla TaxID=520843 RepID=A0ABD1M9G0_9FABA
MSKNSLSGLQEHLKLARDYALEGLYLYDTSVIFFDAALAQINKYLSSVEDPLVRAKWTKVKKALTHETQVVKQLHSDRTAFKETRAAASRSQSQTSSFVFQPLDDYPISIHDHHPDVRRPPTRHATRPAWPKEGRGPGVPPGPPPSPREALERRAGRIRIPIHLL